MPAAVIILYEIEKMYFSSVNRVYSKRPADLIDQTFPFQHRALKIYDAFFFSFSSSGHRFQICTLGELLGYCHRYNLECLSQKELF